MKLDYETKQTYTVTVTATDPSFTGINPSNARDSITVTITVTDVNEKPTLSKRALVISGQVECRPPGERQEHGGDIHGGPVPRQPGFPGRCWVTTPATSPYRAEGLP